MDFTKMHRISCGSECAAMKRGITIDPATHQNGYKIRRDDEAHALRLIRSGGLVIIIK